MKNIIVSRVIPLKTINFGEISGTMSTRKMFEMFGQTMTRIVINAADIQKTRPGFCRFDEFLRLLMAYGKPGKLRDLTIVDFIQGANETKMMTAELLPYFDMVIVHCQNLCVHSFIRDFHLNFSLFIIIYIVYIQK